MKKIIALLLVISTVCLAAAENLDSIQVIQSLNTQQVNYSVRQTVETKAKKAAVKKYILRLAPQIQEILIEKAVREYDNFIESVQKIDEKFTQLGADGSGEFQAVYKVVIYQNKINNFLKENGFSVSGGLEIVILEEPMALGQIQLHTVFQGDSSYFIGNYVTVQRRVRDAIIKKVSGFGFDVKLLADDDLYSSYLTKDSTLSGVYYDVESKKFSINRDFLKTVKENNPNTIVLYYRLDALIYDPSTKALRVTIAFSIKNLEKNTTKAFGSSSFELVATSTNKSVLMDEIAYCAETAVSTLLNEGGASNRLNKIIMSIRNNEEMVQGPLKLVINSGAFDGKNRKKLMYALRKELINQKITTQDQLKASNTTIYATVSNPKITSADQLYMEYIIPILEKFGSEIDDNHVNYDNNTLTIKP